MTITDPFGRHHYHFRLQPNPIFPSQIQFPSIAPYINGCCCLWPFFFYIKKLKDYCQCIIGKLHFQFPTHVLQGKKKKHKVKGRNANECTAISCVLPQRHCHPSYLWLGTSEEKKWFDVIQANCVIILLNISLLLRFLLSISILFTQGATKLRRNVSFHINSFYLLW